MTRVFVVLLALSIAIFGAAVAKAVMDVRRSNERLAASGLATLEPRA